MKFKNPVSVVSPVDGEHATNKDYVDDKMVTKTWAEYQALSEEEKNNGTLYDIPDMPVGIGGGGFAVNGNLYPTNAIDDNAVSPNTGWSSKKVMDKLASVKSIIRVDAKPTYADGTITYVKDGTSYTTTDHETWFYYVVNDELYKTIFIDGVEYTKADSSVSFDDFIEKTSIATVLDATVTNEQVVGAKDFYNHTSTRNIKTYTDFTQLGLDCLNCSILDVMNAMPIHSIFEGIIDPIVAPIIAQECLYEYGTLIINKAQFDRVKFYYFPNSDLVEGNLHFCEYHPSTGLSKWSRVCTTSVPDVRYTDISNKMLPTVLSGGTLGYSIINGICYLEFNNITVKKDSMECLSEAILPKACPSTSTNSVPFWYGGYNCLVTAESGMLKLWCSSEALSSGNTTIHHTISYPVAEDWRP